MVGLGLIAVIIIIVLIIVRPGGNADASSDDRVPASTTGAVPKTDADAAKGQAADDAAAAEAAAATADGTCSPEKVVVTAVTDAAVYAADVTPMLSLSVTNTGTTACTMSLGSDVQEYRVTSGADLIWSSKDCQSDPVALEQALQPNTPLTTTPFAWPRTRSNASTCDAKLPAVTGAGASYHLSVIVGGVESTGSKQFILN